MPVPLVSPELPPAASYRHCLSPSPVPLADPRDSLVSRARGREAEHGPRAWAGCAREWAAPLGWAMLSRERARASLGRGDFPGQPSHGWESVRVSEFCSFILFHIFVYRFKNVYLLIDRSKCCGSNFIEFLIVSSFY
jgi:hypothetical protein